MTTAYTSLLGLALPVTGELTGTWGDTVNNYITAYLDGAVAGTQIISGSLTAVTLSKTTGASLSQAGTGATGSSQYQIIRCTGNPASLLTITVPASDKTYIIINATSTSQSVKIVGAGPTTGVTILSGKTSLVTWNGTDFVEITPAVATNLAPASTAGYVYTSNGGSTAPSFQALSVSGFLPTTGGTMTGLITFAANQTIANISGGSIGNLLYQSASNTTAKLGVGTAGQFLQSNGAAVPSWVSISGVGDHEYTLITGNGLGSTNTCIRVFTTVARNVGTAITGDNSATLGASVTINEAGIYSVFYSDFSSVTGEWYGISLNSANLSSTIQSITTYPERLASNQVVVGTRQLCLSFTRRFAVGDVIRPHCTNTVNGANTTNIFSVVKVNS